MRSDGGEGRAKEMRWEWRGSGTAGGAEEERSKKLEEREVDVGREEGL